ncbi:MAG: hypothetical protein HUU26_01970 [Gemmatimonadaceae bacterium]|nr:hypothetical protein [Gemmatimonadaceae bacterium]
MSDALLFTLIFSGLFVLRVILATVVFAMILPAGDRCLNCDATTVRLRSPVLDRCLPWFRKRWCLRCGWQGVLRRGAVTSEPAVREPVPH